MDVQNNPSTQMAQLQNGNSQTRNNDIRPAEDTIQPQRVNIQDQNPSRSELQPSHFKELRMIDEIAREKSLKFIRERRELMKDCPLEILPFETEFEAKKRVHESEIHLYNLILREYLEDLPKEIENIKAKDRVCTLNSENEQLVRKCARLEKELKTYRQPKPSNQASSSRNNN